MKHLHTYENFNEKKPGPHPYHRDLSDDEVEDKEAQMKKQAEMDDDDPEAYKEMPGDKEAREKGQVKTSKHVKNYHELYGDEDETDEALSDYEIKKRGYTKLYKDYPYKKKAKKKELVKESAVNEESKDAYTIRMLTSNTVGGDEVDNFLKKHPNVSIDKIKFALRNDDLNKHGLRNLIQGKLNARMEKQALAHITESTVNEEKAKGDRSALSSDVETALKKKADETGVPISLLRIVYRRGAAAWKTGHRPGAGQEQWAYARVNSFLTKQPGTWGGADKDVAKEVRDGGHDTKLKKG